MSRGKRAAVKDSVSKCAIAENSPETHVGSHGNPVLSEASAPAQSEAQKSSSQAEHSASLEPVDSSHLSADTALAEYIENASRYDGSRTSPQKVALIHTMMRAGRSVNAISQILGMDNRTVSAVLARQDYMIADARMLLKANALGFAGDLIKASQEAADRGKVEGIASVLDRLGVTEPPKSGHQAQVAVQINLHGGPEPQSLVVGAQALVSGVETGPNTHGSDN